MIDQSLYVPDEPTERWAGLSGRRVGDPRKGRPLVFLHGLTFDHRLWRPVLDRLPPGQGAISLDLPGHGLSPALARHHLDDVVDAVHLAVLAAGLDAPVVVGHSLGAMVATRYASLHRAAAVVNVDMPLQSPEPVVRTLHGVAPQLRDDFVSTWLAFQNSMHVELLPEPDQALVLGCQRPSPGLVTSYWQELIESEIEQVVEWMDEVLCRVRRRGLPYVALYGRPVTAEVRAWVSERLPEAQILAWPAGHHFPHLSDPTRFAALVTGLVAGVRRPLSAAV
jgi:pimeloyl-ACP methyl ester carboxylesterase